MTTFYRLESIQLGTPSYSGHIVYRHAVCDKKSIIFKRNKHGRSELSSYEVAFNGLIERFLQPHLTSSQQLVKNESGDVVGVASEHLFYQVHHREGKSLDNCFYEIKKNSSSLTITPCNMTNEEKIPVYFFDQFSSGFFGNLANKEKEGHISFDIESLASVLTSSYTLEEDDLHKGNLGFYVVKKNNKPHIVFMKIDHDLMLSNSVMSFEHSRLLNWRYTRNSFAVTARDLREFPRLIDSNNHYWPTTKRYMTKPGDSKVYDNRHEINEFIAIGQRDDFKQAKWRNFYKHSLLPAQLIEQSLSASFDKSKAVDRANIALITNAVVARQAHLRAVLFSMPEFQNFIKSMTNDDEQSLMDELCHGLSEQDKQPLLAELVLTLRKQRQFCETQVIKGDTPLHVAIRLGDYRYQETWDDFNQFSENENSKGERPLDVAINLPVTPQKDVRQNPYLIAKHLLKEKVEETKRYQGLSQQKKKAIAAYQFPSPYINQAAKAETSYTLIKVLQDVSNDHRYSLKMKKELSIACVKKCIVAQRQNPALRTMLLQFSFALNGKGAIPTTPELKFIRQLRSELWIIRKIRGLYGTSSTQVSLNNIIDNKLKQFSQQHHFFSPRKEVDQTMNGPSISKTPSNDSKSI